MGVYGPIHIVTNARRPVKRPPTPAAAYAFAGDDPFHSRTFSRHPVSSFPLNGAPSVRFTPLPGRSTLWIVNGGRDNRCVLTEIDARRPALDACAH